MQVNISVVLDTRRKKENGYPVKLRVYYKGKAKLFSLGKDLSKQEFESSYNASKPKTDLKLIRDELRAMETKANEIAKNLNPFNLIRFETLFYGETKTKSDVIGYYNDYIENLNKNAQVKTAIGYGCSRNSIASYLKIINKGKVKKFLFDDVTIEFLNAYEKWMLSNGNSEATIGIYLRNLKTLYNQAIAKGEASHELYPFKKGGYQIPSGSKVRKALSKEDLRKLLDANVEKGSHKEKAKDFWFFSYLCSGMNIKDISGLKYSEIDNDSISFVRSKTKEANKGKQIRIVAGLTDYSRAIIEKYGTKPVDKHSYVFPIFKSGMDAAQKVRANDNFVRFINQHIKQLAKSVGIDDSIATYWARHSFATMADRKNVSRSLIQESLGHRSASTTERYLAGFNIEAKQELANSLLDF
jgi:integrase